MSDLGCRVIYITVSYSKYKFSGDFGYWQNEKSFALSYFKKRLETFKMKIDLKNEKFSNNDRTRKNNCKDF